MPARTRPAIAPAPANRGATRALLQDRFGTQRLAARIDERPVKGARDDGDRAFIARGAARKDDLALVEHSDEIEVVIDVPLGGFIKRRDDGGIDFVSPVPCPFNYGSVPDTRSGDGDRIDALVLGPRLARGARVRLQVVARVRFTDAGQDDPKLVCSVRPLGRVDRARIAAFFGFYARAKGLLNLLRGKAGPTRYLGIEER
jgi:inorganic pyrophosphatase